MSDSSPVAAPDLPRHLGVIMDGNRRWAQSHGVTTIEGHKKGYKTLMSLLPVVQRLGIEYVTVYAFSTENWSRSAPEVAGLMKLVVWVARYELKKFVDQGIRILVVGSYDNVPPEVAASLKRAESETAACTGLTVGLCFNYGGQQEMVDTVKGIVASGIAAADVTPAVIAQHLYAPELPPLDLVMRTSGEQRTSGFMLWRAAYAEFYFTDVLWPDVDEAELNKALTAYANRHRRFGS